ncbi:hypothetical protein NPIL_671391 [Nephila pilipes]|uniref:Uncharacterized protein n=1 Tax=Nephila pilipes TaxID=299642 RepID=A0A8X6QE52_NEPPI|nr:hypothetical protein NPIL_671391 [Nephila pilipes]
MSVCDSRRTCLSVHCDKKINWQSHFKSPNHVFPRELTAPQFNGTNPADMTSGYSSPTLSNLRWWQLAKKVVYTSPQRR